MYDTIYECIIHILHILYVVSINMSCKLFLTREVLYFLKCSYLCNMLVLSLHVMTRTNVHVNMTSLLEPTSRGRSNEVVTPSCRPYVFCFQPYITEIKKSLRGPLFKKFLAR